MTENEPKIASILSEVNTKLATNSANKFVYLVKAEDPDYYYKFRWFATLKQEITNQNFMKIIGIELPYTTPDKSKKQKQINEYKELVEKAEGEPIIEVMIPWNRIINIQNLNYQYKK